MSHTTNDWSGLTVANGRYLVRAKLGAGGMGFVYRAHDRNLDADVVIKVPRRSMMDDPEFAFRFAREVRSLVKLAHPNIVKVTDVGEHDGVPFAVMQYLAGGSLEDYAAAGEGADAVPAKLAALADWLPGVASALDFVHSQGYVHRDVKPGNILFDAHGHVFLSDFGVAKALAAAPGAPARRAQTAMTGAGMVVGTPAYMAPELIMGRPCDGRVDQYALASTVFEMLAGRRPFEAPTPTACMVMQTTQEPPLLSRVEPRVPYPLAEAVSRALAKDPGRRFENCASFAAAVVSAAAAGAETAGLGKSPSGRAVRPDQVRLGCPVCEKSLVFPASLMADPEKVRGKRLACPSCHAHLRVAEDGGSLTAAGPGVSNIAPSPRPEATRKAVAPRTPTIPVARPAPAPTPTVRQAAVPPPAGSASALPASAFTARAVVTGVVGGALAALIFAAVMMIPGRSAPKTGRVAVDTSAAPLSASYSLDGRPVGPSLLSHPLDLKAGVHELAVTADGYQPFSRSFPVSAGEDSGFKVLMTRDSPAAAAAPSPAPERPAAASRDESPVPPPPFPPVASVVRPPVRANPILPLQTGPVGRDSPSHDLPKPSPNRPPVEKETLATLLARPESFAGRVVVPTGLYLLGHNAVACADGTVAVHVTRMVFHAVPGNLVSHRMPDPPVLVQVDARLADHLQALNAIRVLPLGLEVIPGNWGDNAAVLTFHVQQVSDGGGDRWVPTVKKVEFLVWMNLARIGEGKFGESFKSMVVTASGVKSVGQSDRRDWSHRLGVPYTTQVKRIVHNIKDAQFARDMAQINAAMGNQLGNLLRNNVDPASALSGQLRRGMIGR